MERSGAGQKLPRIAAGLAALALLLLLVLLIGGRDRRVDEPDIAANPVVAAQAAIAAERWQFAPTMTPAGEAIEGVRCSFPAEMWGRASRPPRLSLHGPVREDSHAYRLAAARFNTILASDSRSPHAGLCRQGGAMLRAGREGIAFVGDGRSRGEDWSVLQAVPRPVSLMAALRAGRLSATATLPLGNPVKPDLFGIDAMGWAVIRDDRFLLLRFAKDLKTRRMFCHRMKKTRVEADLQRPEQSAIELAVDRKNAFAAGLLMGMLLRRDCASGSAAKPLGIVFLNALSLAETRRGEDTIIALLRARFAGDRLGEEEQFLGATASRLLASGLPRAAAAAEALLLPRLRSNGDHPIVRAANACDVAALRFWLAEPRIRANGLLLATAFGAVAGGLAPGSSGRPPALRCLPAFEMLVHAGQRLDPGSRLLIRAIEVDRYGDRPPVNAETALQVVSAFVRAGGDLTLDIGTPPAQRVDDRWPDRGCTVFDIAEGSLPRYCHANVRAGWRPSMYGTTLRRHWPEVRALVQKQFHARETAARRELGPICRVPLWMGMVPRQSEIEECHRRFGRNVRVRYL